jgi:hypothetical protein
LKKGVLEQLLGCAPLFWLLLEHFAQEIEELLFILSLKTRDGLSNPEVTRDQVLADEFPYGAKGNQHRKVMRGPVHINLTITIEKRAAKILACVSTQLSFGVLNFRCEGHLARYSLLLKKSLWRRTQQGNHLCKIGMHIVVSLLVPKVDK